MMNTFTSMPSSAQVASSWMFIWNEPSPERQTTAASGQPTLAPIAAGKFLFQQFFIFKFLPYFFGNLKFA